MDSFETVGYSVADHVATITLNRAQAMNAFDRQLRADLLGAVRLASEDKEVRVAVLTGAGRAFSAGADLNEPPPGDVHRMIEDEYKPSLVAIAESPKPFIAAVNGAAAGIGASYAMACDLMIMADDAYLYEAFIAIGLIPDGGATWQLVHQLGRKRAYEMIVEGKKIPAVRCVELGLANRVAPADQLQGEAHAWARSLAQKAPLAMRYSKEALNRALHLEFGDAISCEAKLQNITLTSEDAAEGVTAFLEKRAPVFKGR